MRSLQLALILGLAAVLPGCLAMAAAAGAAAAYGYVQYDENQAYRDYRADVDVTFAAAAAVLRQDGRRVPESATFKSTRGEVLVDDIELHVTANSSISSRVTVRVGTFSNTAHRERAGAILDAIAVRLGE